MIIHCCCIWHKCFLFTMRHGRQNWAAIQNQMSHKQSINSKGCLLFLKEQLQYITTATVYNLLNIYLVEIRSRTYLNVEDAVSTSCDPYSFNRTGSSAEIFPYKRFWARLAPLLNKRIYVISAWLVHRQLSYMKYFINPLAEIIYFYLIMTNIWRAV